MRRWLAIATLCCWLASATGLVLALHVAHEHDGHDEESCTVCQALHYNKASAPQDKAVVSFDAPPCLDEPRPADGRVIMADPARPIASRAPPTA